MAIKKMELINLVGQLDDFDCIMREIILSEQVQLTNAYDQIDQSKFTLSMMQDNIDEIVDLSLIEHYEPNLDLSILHKKLDEIMDSICIEKKIKYDVFKENYNFKDVIEMIEKIYGDFKVSRMRVRELEEERSILKELLEIKSIEGLDIDFETLMSLDMFDVKFGKLTPENKKRLSMNYENITAAVIHLQVNYDSDLYLVVTPKKLEKETNRILRSVYFDEIELLDDYLGTPDEIVTKINNRIDEILMEIEEHFDKIVNFQKKYNDKIKECYSRLIMQEKIHELSKKIASTEHFFYLSGWVDQSIKEKLTRKIQNNNRNVIVDYKGQQDEIRDVKPPTKLKNLWLFEPFEELVNMYGIPNYNEIDPTAFFAVTYMILFGAMFGDLGQGLIFLLAGIFLYKYKAKKLFGGILSRLGISSMIFGFFYDSFFGYENIISRFFPKYLFIRPLENINTLLYSGIGLGIFLLIVSFGFSIYVKNKNKNIKEGLFGRDGLIGLILYLTLLILVFTQFTDFTFINSNILIAIVLLSTLIIFFREPIANKIKGSEFLYDHSPGEYYMESGFDLIETFLSLLSNSVSFIRVGAFALSHVGLFVAFHTMARIIGNVFGDISMFILGNLLVIFLEGLIVFIQGLRLVYYEIFSKYYIGDGYKFNPTKLD